MTKLIPKKPKRTQRKAPYIEVLNVCLDWGKVLKVVAVYLYCNTRFLTTCLDFVDYRKSENLVLVVGNQGALLITQ